MGGPEILLNSELKSALVKLKRNKAKESDEIAMEMLEVLDDLGFDKIINIISYTIFIIYRKIYFHSAA